MSLFRALYVKLSERKKREREMKEENGLDTGLLHQVITLWFLVDQRLHMRERRKNKKKEERKN